MFQGLFFDFIINSNSSDLPDNSNEHGSWCATQKTIISLPVLCRYSSNCFSFYSSCRTVTLWKLGSDSGHAALHLFMFMSKDKINTVMVCSISFWINCICRKVLGFPTFHQSKQKPLLELIVVMIMRRDCLLDDLSIGSKCTWWAFWKWCFF